MSINPSYYLDIASKQLESYTSLLNRILPNGVVPTFNHIWHNIVLTGNHISHHIGPTDNHIPHNIVSISNISLLKHFSYSVPSVYIRCFNGIDFTYYSHLYCDIQRLIVSLVLLLQPLMSSFWLNFLFLFSRSDYPSYISLQPFFTILKNLYLLGISLPIAYLLVVFTANFPVIVLSFIVLSSITFSCSFFNNLFTIILWCYTMTIFNLQFSLV